MRFSVPSPCRSPALLLWAATLGGCSGAADAPAAAEWSGTIDTLAGGRVVVRSPDVPLEGEWHLVEEFRLGSLTAMGPELFGSIVALAFDPAGGLIVLDGQAEEIRQWDAEGRYLRTVGGSGEGPGELDGASGLALDGEGTAWVLNWRNARYTGFDSRSGVLRAEWPRRAGFIALPWGGAFAGGRLVDVGLDAEGAPAFLGLDTAFAPRDTLSIMRSDLEGAGGVPFRRGGLLVAAITDPFTPRPVWAVHPRGGIVGGSAAEYRLLRVDFTGDTTRVIHLGRPRVAVPAAARDSALADFEERAAALVGGGATAGRSPRPASHFPSYTMIAVDDRDRLWVRAVAPSGGPPAWDVFDPEGRYLARVPTPDGVGYLPPAVQGDRMAVAVMRDGVPEIAVYSIVAKAPG